MKLSELITALQELNEVAINLPNGTQVPSHFHLTEIGLSTKTFVDCGGKKHQQKKVTLQLWTSIDYHHRLKADKFLSIINTSLPLFEGEDLDVEVEYQTDTIGKFELSYNGKQLELLNTQTDCLATELCGIDALKTKAKKSLQQLGKATSTVCTPGGGCC